MFMKKEQATNTITAECIVFSLAHGRVRTREVLGFCCHKSLKRSYVTKFFIPQNLRVAQVFKEYKLRAKSKY